MVYRGTIQNGVVVFEESPRLPDGTAVRVEPIQQPMDNPTRGATNNGEKSIWDRLQKLAGVIEDLPSDYAAEHDRYRRERLSQ